MKLDEYWSRLEYLVSAALYDDGRGYWCDGFIPDEFVLSEDGQTVHGRA